MEIGCVGLGAMGELIVSRLMAAGHTVTGWNRSRGKAEPMIAAGMKWADTPRAVATASEIVFSIVTDQAAVKAVALGPSGIVSGLRKGGIYIDMSTIEPDASREVAAEFAKAGSIMLDGPLSGSPVTVKAGQASVMIGGDEMAFERAKPVLLAIGPKVTRIGGNGLACQMKIAVNLLLMVEVICFGEAVALAEKGGVGREVAVDAILKSVAASPVLVYRGPFIIDGKMPAVPLADVTLQQKDMMLALDLGRKLGSPVPLAAAANEMMNACRGLGIDGNDFVVAHRVYRRLGGQDAGGQDSEGQDSGQDSGGQDFRRTSMTGTGARIGAALAKAVKATTGITSASLGARMYRTNIKNVPKVEGLKRDDGWVDMQVQFLIDKKSAGADHVVGWTVLKPGASHEQHLHRNCDEFFIVLKGNGHIITDKGLEPSGEGDVVYSPRGVWHGFNNTSDQDVVLVWGWMGAGSIESSGYENPPEGHKG